MQVYRYCRYNLQRMQHSGKKLWTILVTQLVDKLQNLQKPRAALLNRNAKPFLSSSVLKMVQTVECATTEVTKVADSVCRTNERRTNASHCSAASAPLSQPFLVTPPYPTRSCIKHHAQKAEQIKLPQL